MEFSTAVESFTAINGDLLPTQVTCCSGKRVWWKCHKCGYEWQAGINNRVSKNTGCPVCAGKVILVGYNDLATLYPNFSDEWNYEKNGNLLPTQVTCCSGKKVWWKCNKCGHEWETYVINRINGSSCPVCAGKKSFSWI
ncbi:MAG: zinc-ribbon domain-containing protein [Synergistaceae bacterium]|nr:zinc-ribbon domain-containing protein [Synergistaceae bacterium]